MSPKHGQARILQMQNRKPPIIGSQIQGNKKKIASISIGQLRARYPQYAAMSDVDLIKKIREEHR
ncbi:MAG: hypothetical protein WC821_04245 [archaeon]|jgi:hypothetical protein